jgi:hypothetical protein
MAANSKLDGADRLLPRLNRRLPALFFISQQMFLSLANTEGSLQADEHFHHLRHGCAHARDYLRDGLEEN